MFEYCLHWICLSMTIVSNPNEFVNQEELINYKMDKNRLSGQNRSIRFGWFRSTDGGRYTIHLHFRSTYFEPIKRWKTWRTCIHACVESYRHWTHYCDLNFEFWTNFTCYFCAGVYHNHKVAVKLILDNSFFTHELKIYEAFNAIDDPNIEKKGIPKVYCHRLKVGRVKKSISLQWL